MKFFGQEADPWDLFLVFVLLLGATGFFSGGSGGRPEKAPRQPAGGTGRRRSGFRVPLFRTGTLPA